jgi:hypothetical protein
VIVGGLFKRLILGYFLPSESLSSNALAPSLGRNSNSNSNEISISLTRNSKRIALSYNIFYNNIFSRNTLSKEIMLYLQMITVEPSRT